MKIEDLKKIGFKFAGKWQIGTNNDKYDDGLKDEILSENRNFIYCFIISDEIVYVGKSDRSPRVRIRNGWARNKKKSLEGKSTTGGHHLADAINGHQNVETWIWFPSITVKEVSINYEFSPEILEGAAINGVLRLLEKTLINSISPKWNGNS